MQERDISQLCFAFHGDDSGTKNLWGSDLEQKLEPFVCMNRRSTNIRSVSKKWLPLFQVAISRNTCWLS